MFMFTERTDQPICIKWSCWILAQAHVKLNDNQKQFLKTKLKIIAENRSTEKLIKHFAKQALSHAEK